jgi:hypothetical protein
MTMPWGKHRGERIDDIDSSYLAWVIEHCDNVSASLRVAILDELAARFGRTHTSPASVWRAPCPDAPLATAIVSAGQKMLAKKHHPDAGGDTRTMQTVNAVADWLKAQVPQ